ncbi:MAG: hypothetical protein JSW51_05820 [Gemmatimonadota bacterium]|nr:MAG: hypothetical protein JSW51_05820 [Gemmatimonadota bacterium]
MSSRAQTCPRCAYPFGKGRRGLRKTVPPVLPSPYRGLELTKTIVARVLVGGIVLEERLDFTERLLAKQTDPMQGAN